MEVREQIKKTSVNLHLSKVFEKMALCYRYLGPSERFRALAYDQAAKTLANMKEDIVMLHDVRKLDALKGIGTHIAAKIIEFLDTGKIQTYDDLQKQVPIDLMELTNIEGIGPATIRHLHDELKVNDRKGLKAMLLKSPLVSVKGVDKTKMKKISAALNMQASPSERMPLESATKMATSIIRQIKKINGVIKVVAAGSLRRKRPTIGDLDLLVIAEEKDFKHLLSTIQISPNVDAVISSGRTKASMKLKRGGVQMDIRVVLPNEEGSALLYFTGPKAFNIALRKMAGQKGYLLNEYGLFRKTDGYRVAGHTEEDIFSALQIAYIKPEEREENKDVAIIDKIKR